MAQAQVVHDDPPCDLGYQHDFSQYGNYCMICGYISPTRRKISQKLAPIGRPTKTQAQIMRLFQRDGQQCYYCHDSFKLLNGFFVTPNLSMATRDHVKPRALGGSSHLSNLVVACQDCNKAKSHLWLVFSYGVWMLETDYQHILSKQRSHKPWDLERAAKWAQDRAIIIPGDYDETMASL